MTSRQLALVVALACVPGALRAQSSDADAVLEELSEQARRVDVIQNRKYELLHELSMLGGGLPSDPYYYGLTGTVGYALHLTHGFAWEIGQLTYSYNLDKQLKRNLLTTAMRSGMEAPDLPAIQWFVASHLVLKPLYGKEAIFNTEIVHLEAFVQGGPALVHTTDLERAYSFGVDLGGGLRLWLSEVLSLRFDLGELVYWMPSIGGKKSDMKGALHLRAGIAFNLRGES